MNIDRRRFLGLAGAAVAGTALSACGGNTGSSGNNANGKSGKITVWGSFNDKKTGAYYQKNYIDAYNHQAAGGTVTFIPKPSANFEDAERLALSAGSGPDILSGGIPKLVEWAGAGYLASLDDYATKFNWPNAFKPWALEVGKINGKLVMLPSELETMVCLYNPATFKAHGWSIPANREEFEALCADAAGHGIMPVAAGNADYQQASEWLVTIWLNHAAGPDAVHSALTGKTPWTDPVFVNAIDQLNGYIGKGWIGGGRQSYFTNKFDSMYSDLSAGKAAMMLTGSWGLTEAPGYFGAAANNNAEWDWAPLWPMGSGVPAEVWELAVGSVWAINAKSSDRDLAAGYLNFVMTGARLQTQALADVGFEPAPLRFTAKDFSSDLDPRWKRLYTSLSSATNVGYTTWTFWPGPADTYLFTNIDKVFAGKTSATEYLSGLQDVFAKTLAKGQVPPIPAPKS